ncbi:MAG: TetR family transcriptional regulator [Pseudomonadales bacterium]|nr:TetR family transcriptional regulator [Pseudomonadales bacterium]
MPSNKRTQSKEDISSTAGVDDKSPRSRTDRKEATRHRILMAAWQLVEEGRTPSELGLREVARTAGMAAPSIYNHFADMDELGLALLDDSLARLRPVARAARKMMCEQEPTKALHKLVQKYLRDMGEYEVVLRLLIQQWFNPNPEYRRTIRREMSILRQDLAESMRLASETLSKGKKTSRGFAVESDAIFSFLITYILNAMDLSPEKRMKRLRTMEQQVRMILKGGDRLRD